MASITQYKTSTGVKRWRVDYRKPGSGRQYTKRGFSRRKDAEAWAAEHVVTAIAQGSYVDPVDSRTTVGALLPAWLEKKRLACKPSYLDDLEDAARVYVLPAWGHVALRDVTRSGVQRWVSDIASGRFTSEERQGSDARLEGKPKSASVVKRAHGVLAGVLDDAVADRLVATNAARGVTLPRKERSRHVYLTAPELFRLAGECGYHRSLVLTLGLTGMRWGEATALRIDDVDRARRRISVTKSATQVRGRVVIGSPKTSEVRSVFYPAMLDDILPLAGRHDDSLLFFDPDGLPGGYVRQLKSPKAEGWFARACDAAGLPRMTLHDLRHTAASLMVSTGASVKSVQRQLGHASAAMTLDVYADLFDADLESAAAGMEELLRSCDVGALLAPRPGAAA